MIINSSSIGMESARRYTSSSVKGMRYQVKDYNRNAQTGTSQSFADILSTGGEEGEETKKMGQSLENLQDRMLSYSSKEIRFGRSEVENTLFTIRQECIRYIFSLLFWDSGSRWRQALSEEAAKVQADSTVQNVQSAQKTDTLSDLYSSEEIYFHETEDTYFSTVGTVRTADGREINFNVDVGMSREFTSYLKNERKMNSVQMCDPLVINLDGNTAGLSDQKFFFDLDADGKEENISMLASGSGYLALDKNGDGIINDGRELFGTKNGDGFADLAQYDADGNGWIDEADPIWSQLKIWVKNENGEDELYSLAQKGVGAICLQKAATDFALKTQENQDLGNIRSTGIFLFENGRAGTVQHLDVAT